MTVSVFGKAGLGKGRLLRRIVGAASAGELYRNEPAPVTWTVTRRKLGNFRSLPVMNPSVWSQEGSFLYAFLAHALEQHGRQRTAEAGFPAGLSPVHMSFRTVSEHLGFIDGGEDPVSDPLGFGLSRLERQTSGLRLRDALSAFLATLAVDLGSKNTILLLPIEGLDMHPGHLMGTLQTLQSFLKHPVLIPVLTFTDDLVQRLVRVHYRNELDKGPEPRISLRSASAAEKDALVFAQRFLDQCLPPESRIMLSDVESNAFVLASEEAALQGVKVASGSEYDVALSFAGEDRALAQDLAEILNRKGKSVFYDAYEQAGLWGRDLAMHLHHVYSRSARFCVIFVSAAYAKKVWTTHELKCALERAVHSTGEEYILPVRLDDTEIDGIPSNLGYLSIAEGIPRIAELLLEKLDSSSPAE